MASPPSIATTATASTTLAGSAESRRVAASRARPLNSAASTSAGDTAPERASVSSSSCTARGRPPERRRTASTTAGSTAPRVWAQRAATADWSSGPSSTREVASSVAMDSALAAAAITSSGSSGSHA